MSLRLLYPIAHGLMSVSLQNRLAFKTKTHALERFRYIFERYAFTQARPMNEPKVMQPVDRRQALFLLVPSPQNAASTASHVPP